MTNLTITLPRAKWELLVDYADKGIDEKLYWIKNGNAEDEVAERADVDAACEALQGVINALRQKPGNSLVDALRWALDQIEDDLDPDHQAALSAARAAIAQATQEA